MAYKQRKYYGTHLIKAVVTTCLITLALMTTISLHGLSETARLRGVITDIKEISWQIHNFKTLYHQWPGDFDEANTHWPATKNGNGNNLIEEYEQYTAWQQLMLSRLVPGKFDGVSQVKKTPLKDNIGYHLMSIKTPIYNNQGHQDNGMLLYHNEYHSDTIVPSQAAAIDRKIDDNIPNTGQLLGYSIENKSCATSKQGTVTQSFTGKAQYNFKIFEPSCTLLYWIRNK